jgi:hypothetical protein
MGGSISKNKGHEVVLDNEICHPLPNNKGKFLLQSMSNKGIEIDGSGGVYLSCNMDGTLSGSKTENDPELWRVQYQDEPHPRLFRLFNTSKELFIVAGICKQVFTDSDESYIQIAHTSNLFYLVRDKKSEETYYICTNFQSYLSQSSAGKVTLCDFKDCCNDIKWKLMPSF